MIHMETSHMERRIIFRQAVNLLNWKINSLYSHFYLHLTPTKHHFPTLVIWTMGPRVWRVTRHCWWVVYNISHHCTAKCISFDFIILFYSVRLGLQQKMDNRIVLTLFINSQQQNTDNRISSYSLCQQIFAQQDFFMQQNINSQQIIYEWSKCL